MDMEGKHSQRELLMNRRQLGAYFVLLASSAFLTACAIPIVTAGKLPDPIPQQGEPGSSLEHALNKEYGGNLLSWAEMIKKLTANRVVIIGVGENNIGDLRTVGRIIEDMRVALRPDRRSIITCWTDLGVESQQEIDNTEMRDPGISAIMKDVVTSDQNKKRREILGLVRNEEYNERLSIFLGNLVRGGIPVEALGMSHKELMAKSNPTNGDQYRQWLNQYILLNEKYATYFKSETQIPIPVIITEMKYLGNGPESFPGYLRTSGQELVVSVGQNHSTNLNSSPLEGVSALANAVGIEDVIIENPKKVGSFFPEGGNRKPPDLWIALSKIPQY